MEELFNGTTNAIKGFFSSFGIIQDKMMEIDLFKIVIAIVILTICISILFYIVKKIKQLDNITEQHRKRLIKDGFSDMNGVDAEYWTKKQVRKHYMAEKRFK